MLKVDELLKATAGRLTRGQRDFSIRGFSLDSRTIKKDEAFIAIKGENFDGHCFINEAIKKGASCIIREAPGKKYEQASLKVRGYSPLTIEVNDTIKALGKIARYLRQKYRLPVIAISGSNGKTTTKEMLAWVLSKKFKVLKNEGTKNNYIGLAQTLLKLNSGHTIAVVELGTSHPGEIELLCGVCLPNIGVITNIGLAHLEYFDDLRGVFREKYSLIENLEKPGIGILNADELFLRKENQKKTKQPFILGFAIKNKSDFQATDIRSCFTRLEFLVNLKNKFVLNTCGRHNVYNALAAIAVARLFGLNFREVASGLADFVFPPGRLKIREFNRIKFIDDTYNSNPTSFKQAIDALNNFKGSGRRIVVMGDMLELGLDGERLHRKIGRHLAKSCDMLITVGGLSKETADAAKSCGLPEVYACETTGEAGGILSKRLALKKNDTVLVKGSRAMKMEEVFYALSPALSFTR